MSLKIQRKWLQEEAALKGLRPVSYTHLFVGIKVVEGEERNRLADAMVQYGEESGKKNWDRDGENVRRSDAVLLISLDQPQAAGLNCGACGFKTCAELPKAQEGLEFAGPLCAWRLMDLGIALGLSLIHI